MLKIAACVVSICLLAGFPIGSAEIAAQRSRPPAAPPPSPAPALPQISVIGIRVVGAGLGKNGSELRAFNERPGTSVAVALQAPAGSGIVEIDNHASKLDAFSDDKGQSLLEEGRIGPFPKIAEDGSAALVEIEVQARPSAGAVSVSAQGSVAMMLSSGSKPQRIPNVRLEPARALKVGTATVTINEAKADEESTKITFGLSRALLNTIRSVRFFDAKNAPIESRRTGSGYINDKAELETNVQTKEKVVAIEFDVWQNLRTVKVPFNIQAGLGVAPGGRPAPTTDAARGGKDDAAPAPDNRPAPTIAPGEGAASVDAVVKQMQAAAVAGKGADLLAVIYPYDRTLYAQTVAMGLAFLPMAKLSDEKAAKKTETEVEALYAKHTIAMPLSGDADAKFKHVNLKLFLSDALALIKSQTNKGEDAMLPVPKGKPQDIKVTGDTATAAFDGKDVKFARVSGRWFIRVE